MQNVNTSAILELATLFVLTTENLRQGVDVDKELKFKSGKSMQVEFLSNNIDVMTHGFFSSLALALVAYNGHHYAGPGNNNIFMCVCCSIFVLCQIGINPGLFAAYKGHHYAGPGNHFCKSLIFKIYLCLALL